MESYEQYGQGRSWSLEIKNLNLFKIAKLNNKQFI
jgi:hypothetical protein